MPFLGLMLFCCLLSVPRTSSLELEHKGELHKVSQMIQESQGEIDCYV